MENSEQYKATLRYGIYGSVSTMIGILLSGPIGMVVVASVKPQPLWQGAQVFVANFHVVQTFPFFAGFALVAGYIVTMAAIYHIAPDNQKTPSLVALVLTSVFAALIMFNYINQTTFVPALVREYRPEYDPLIAAFSFSNPNSVSWAIEMWGYALFGLATAAAAPVFNRKGPERATRWLMVANGFLSVVGAIIVSGNLAWVFTTSGFIAYSAWNVLVFILSLCMIGSFRKRLKA